MTGGGGGGEHARRRLATDKFDTWYIFYFNTITSISLPRVVAEAESAPQGGSRRISFTHGIFSILIPLPLYHFLERVCTHISCRWQESVGHPSYDLQFQMSELHQGT